MSSLLYIKFDYHGEKVWLVDYIERMLGTPHPPRVTKTSDILGLKVLKQNEGDIKANEHTAITDVSHK